MRDAKLACPNRPDRRAFFRFAASVAAVQTGQRLLADTAVQVPPIGILLATTYTMGTVEERLDRAKAAGLDCVQMAWNCAGLAEMPDHIPDALPGRIHRAAAARNVRIASVTGTFNMAHPDPQQRKDGLRSLRVIAESCSGLGTSLIHICTGTRNTRSMWAPHPDNELPETWKDMTACLREAAEIARQAHVTLGFEPEVGNVVDSAGKARRLMNEIGSPHLKVTFDPSNLFHTGELPRMKEILDEAFAIVGKDIVMAHAKDLDRDGAAGHLPAGKGRMDYAHFMRLLISYNYKGPILLHGLTEQQVPECLAFVRAKRDDAVRGGTLL